MHRTNYSQLHTSLLTQSHKSINESAEQGKEAELALALELLGIPLGNKSSPGLFSHEKAGGTWRMFINILPGIRESTAVTSNVHGQIPECLQPLYSTSSEGLSLKHCSASHRMPDSLRIGKSRDFTAYGQWNPGISICLTFQEGGKYTKNSPFV